MTQAPIWEASVGAIPWKVVVFEMAARKRVLYLRWRSAGNWKYLSLAAAAHRVGFEPTLYDADGHRLVGRAMSTRQRWALDQAEEQYAKLRAGVAETAADNARAPLLLSETWALVEDADMGKYPADSPHRREMKREMQNAVRILGRDMPWDAVRVDHLVKLWRTRIRELTAAKHTGVRGAEITVSHFLTIGGWLRDRGRIGRDCCIAPRTWRLDLRSDWRALTGSDRDAEPNRPRYTVEEIRRIIEHAPAVDPRFGLMVSIGVELRLGQVIRARRTDLSSVTRPIDGDDDGATITVWRLRIFGAGRKRGTLMELTPRQASALEAALSGYLREFEAAYRKSEIEDYFLFPGGRIRGARGEHPYVALSDRDPMVADRIDGWWSEAEDLADIKHVKGRGAYGGRRAGTDGAKSQGISRDALKMFGGWTDTQIPDQIYADQDLDASVVEAAKVRAKVRGETE